MSVDRYIFFCMFGVWGTRIHVVPVVCILGYGGNNSNDVGVTLYSCDVNLDFGIFIQKHICITCIMFAEPNFI